MAKAKQLTIQIENRPGTAARVARVLGDARVNILAFIGSTQGTQGSVQVLVDDTKKARKALTEANLAFSEADVEQVELPNTPGALGQQLEKLAAKGVNFSCIYATTSKGSRKASVVVIAAEATSAKG